MAALAPLTTSTVLTTPEADATPAAATPGDTTAPGTATGNAAGQLTAALWLRGLSRPPGLRDAIRETYRRQQRGQEPERYRQECRRRLVAALATRLKYRQAQFREEDHPRDEGGKFAEAEKHDVPYETKKGEKKTRPEWRMPGGHELPAHLGKTKLPPGWRSAKVSTDPKHHVVAVGVDAKGREQRIYSEEHVRKQAAAKFQRIQEGIRKLDDIKRQNAHNLKSDDPNTRENAAVWRLINHTGIRPGSDRDTKAEKQAYGATTLLGQHVTQDKNGQVVLRFTGKKGVDLAIPIQDQSIASDLLKRKSAAGDGGRLFATDAGKLLDYTHTLNGGGFKTKDFRTIRGTIEARRAVEKLPRPQSEKERKKLIRQVAERVSETLGNTPTVALQSYIDPHVFDPWKLETAA